MFLLLISLLMYYRLLKSSLVRDWVLAVDSGDYADEMLDFAMYADQVGGDGVGRARGAVLLLPRVCSSRPNAWCSWSAGSPAAGQRLSIARPTTPM